MMDTAIDIAAARSAVERASERFAVLLGDVADPDARVPRCAWNVSDVAAHVVLATEVNTAFAEGETEPAVDLSDVAGGSVARSNATWLEDEPERDLTALAPRLGRATEALLRVTAGRPGSDPVVWNSQQISLVDLLGILLGELLLHGRDIARASSRPWAIEKDDARMVLAAVLPVMPVLVNRAATTKVDATYDIRIRGGQRAALHIHNGEATVATKNGDADCHVSADPVAMLLVCYGRQSQWLPALTGRVVAWGRKPWLGLRLTKYLVTP
jgi:uncharacterized protein (TIGR03083 family)